MGKIREIIGVPNFDDSKVSVAERTDLYGNKVKRLILEGTAIVCDEPGSQRSFISSCNHCKEVEKLNRTKIRLGRLAAELNHPRVDIEGTRKTIPSSR
jgi:hypothetical protein